jgi:putative endonuclease
MVRCRDGSLYTGVSNDVPSRVDRHNDGKGARYTRSRRPVKLVWKRRVKDKSAALKLEAAMKKLPRGSKLRLLINPSVRLSSLFSRGER